MTSPQLDLFGIVNPEGNHGSKPVPEPAGTGPDDRFRNRSPNSSMIPRFQTVPLTGERESGTGSTKQGPLPGEREAASLSPPGDEETRGADRNTSGAIAESKIRNRSGTDQKPPGSKNSEQPTLRPYQAEGRRAVLEQFRAGVKRTLLVLPTGCGKTIVFAELARLLKESRGGRALVIAHRTELLDQAAEKVRAVGLSVSIEQGASRSSSTSDVVVASVQTLRGARLAKFAHDAFDFIVIDEAHHAVAAGYQGIVDHFPEALVLGVTATPQRADGKALRKVFETTAFTYELRQAIADQWLVPIRARRVRITDVDMSAIKSHHGDLDQTELSAVLRESKALQGVVGPLVQIAGTRKTMVFTVDVAHANAIAAELNKMRQGCAIALDGDAPKPQRKAVLDLFRKGAFQFLVNCALFTEGFDEASIQCVALARPTMSVGLYIQMVGRGTRLLGKSYAESVANGKPELLLLDFVGNTRHRLAGPADALAGEMLPPEVVEQVDAGLSTGKAKELELVLAEAQALGKAAAQKKAELAIAHYRTTEIDPLIGHIMPPLDPSSPAYHKPATEKQLEAIDAAGLGIPPAGLTLGEASRILDGLAERRRLGLATVGQVKLLKKFKLDCSNMTKQRATELFLKGKARGFSGEWIYRNEPEYRAGGKS